MRLLNCSGVCLIISITFPNLHGQEPENGFHPYYQKESVAVTPVAIPVISPEEADISNQTARQFSEEQINQYTITAHEQKDYEYHAPSYLFAIDNDSAQNAANDNWYSRGYVQCLYPESFLKKKLPVLLNGSKCWNIVSKKMNTSAMEEEIHTLKLGGNDGYKENTISFSLLKTRNSILKGKRVKYLAIGDSLVGNTIPDDHGEYTVGWNHSSEAKRLSLLDSIDFGLEDSVVCLGTLHRNTKARFEYKGTSYEFRACDEGRGSWTTSNYLRHPVHVTTTKSGSGADMDNKTAWDAMGLGRKISIEKDYDENIAYEEYIYSTEQRKRIECTAVGYFHWDYSSELWMYLKKKYPLPFEGLGNLYTGGEEDKAAMRTMEEKALSAIGVLREAEDDLA